MTEIGSIIFWTCVFCADMLGFRRLSHKLCIHLFATLVVKTWAESKVTKKYISTEQFVTNDDITYYSYTCVNINVT